MRRTVLLCVLLALGGCAGLSAEPGEGPAPEDVDMLDEEAVGDVRNATVVDVVDGDTVDVRFPNGTTDRVRLLGVDTPEVHVENDPSEFAGVPDTEAGASCLRNFGEAAGDALRERVDGERVRLVVDATADRRGGFDRLLAYVVHDGTDLNYWLVAQGHARVYPTTFARADAYGTAQGEARDADRGIWQCRSPGSAARSGPETGVQSGSA